MIHKATCPIPIVRIAFAASLLLLSTMETKLYSQPNAAHDLDGYLFIEGEYVPPPYRIKSTDTLITINGEEFDESDFDIASIADESPRNGGSGRFGGMRWRPGAQGPQGFRGFSPLARTTRQLKEVNQGSIVIFYKQEKPLVIHLSADNDQAGDRLLGSLVGDADFDSQAPEHFTEKQQAIWDRLINGFHATEDFTGRATQRLEALKEATRKSEQIMKANLLVARISYPLTVFAMVAIVLAFGHLLSNPPKPNHDAHQQTESRKLIVRSLVIIALFSALDLIWTLIATNAGTMRELNPLGSQYIDEPVMLATFKLVVTAMSIGILYALHRKPVAQVASWWCCLLLTLLTARWVIFQSMFA